jgi:hypothetical protein
MSQEYITKTNAKKIYKLSDEILFHTFFIAYKFEQHINTIISTITKDLHNTTTAFNYDTTVKGSDYNIANNIIELFKDKILETNEKKISAYIQRIANIFYKAINVCYDNKTDFSKNIIDYLISYFWSSFKILDRPKMNTDILNTLFFEFVYILFILGRL